MIVGVTGHRPDKIGGYWYIAPLRVAVRDAIVAELARLGPERALTGMALGVDQDFAAACVELKIPFVAVIPFVGQDKRWPPGDRDRYDRLCAAAERVHVTSEGGYAPWKMQARNRWLVDNCDVLLAVWDGSSGGTANCVRYAQKVGREIKRIDPSKL